MTHKDFENYYDARQAIHSKIDYAMGMAYRTHENMLSVGVKMVAIGILIAAFMQGLSTLGGNPAPSAGLWAVAIIAGLYLFETHSRSNTTIAKVSKEFVESENIALNLHSLYGAPHDRLRNDYKAGLHAVKFKEALTQKTPIKYYLSMTLYMFGAMGIGNAAMIVLFADLNILTSPITLLQCAAVIPGFILHRKHLHERAVDTDERAVMAAFHLSEFGLTTDREHALGGQDED